MSGAAFLAHPVMPALGRAACAPLFGAGLAPDSLGDCRYTKKEKIFFPSFLRKLTNGDLWNATPNAGGNPLLGICD